MKIKEKLDNILIDKIAYGFDKPERKFLYVYLLEKKLKNRNLTLPKKLFNSIIFKNTEFDFYKNQTQTLIDGKIKSVAIYINRDQLNRSTLIKKIKGNFKTSIFLKYNSLKYHSSPLGNDYFPDIKYNKVLKTDKQIESEIIKLVGKKIAHPSNFLLNILQIFQIKKYLHRLKINLFIFDKNADLNKGSQLIPLISINEINKNLASKILEKLDSKLNIIEDYLYFKYYDHFYILEKEFINENLEILYNIALDEDLKKLKKELKIVSGIKPQKNDKILKEIELEINGNLFPLQQVGVSWLWEHYSLKTSGALLADEMGSGKTIQSLAFLALINKREKLKKNDVLIITPAIIVDVWKNEIRQFVPQLEDKCHIMSFQKFLSSDNSNCKILIIDETQNLKNKNTKIYDKVDVIKRKFTLLLSGTPVENKAQDLHNIIRLINPIFSRFFRTLYKIVKDESIIISKTLKIIRPYILARKVSKEQLNTKVNFNNIIVSTNPKYNEKIINKRIQSFYGDKLRKIKSKNSLEYYNDVIIALIKARQLTSLPYLLKNSPSYISNEVKDIKSSSKMDKLFSVLETFKKDDNSIIFTLFTESAKLISEKLKCPLIIGSTSQKNREKIIKEYQNGIHKNIVIALKAGNAGITLTKANKVIFYDLWWNPAVLSQAIARAYRIGQTRDVDVYYFILKGSIDELILNILDKKKIIIDTYNSDINKIPDKEVKKTDLNELYKFFD